MTKKAPEFVVISEIMKREEYGVLKCEEVDRRLEVLLDSLNIHGQTRELIKNYWCKMSDHEYPSKLPPPTIDEAWSIGYLADLIERTGTLQ